MCLIWLLFGQGVSDAMHLVKRPGGEWGGIFLRIIFSARLVSPCHPSASAKGQEPKGVLCTRRYAPDGIVHNSFV